MMATLTNKTQSCEVIPKLVVADGFWLRLVGLLGRRSLAMDEGMWFDRCNSIHTIGMRFSIDLIFLDRSMRVKALKKNVRPGRMTWPIFGARSVVEVASGSLDQMKIKIGDELHVGH